MGIRDRYREHQLVKLAKEGRELGFLEDALQILPPEVRRKVEQAEKNDAARKARKAR